MFFNLFCYLCRCLFCHGSSSLIKPSIEITVHVVVTQIKVSNDNFNVVNGDVYDINGSRIIYGVSIDQGCQVFE